MSFPKQHFKSLLSRINFGKYKGTQIGNVIVNDPDYVQWLFSRTNVEVDSSVLRALDTYLYYAK